MTDKIEIAVISLALISSKTLSISALREILNNTHPSSPEELLERCQVSRMAINASISIARASIEGGLSVGILPVLISSSAYPMTLRQIVDAPPLIFVRGNVEALKRMPGVSVVGTRKATIHGIIIAQRIATFLSEEGFSVISGLALGIDAAAHEGALKTTTPTIAVLAHGLEKASPRANAHIADRILENGGLWISEHPFKTAARPEYFVQRNRIQVGLSCASVIVEGEERSGSMTQAEFCLRNRRILFAVMADPSSPVSTQHQLPQMLIANRGALPIRSKADYSTLLDMARTRREELLTRAVVLK
jgi:DNA processing protein